MKVAKFGGSSLASSDQVRKVVNIIKDDPLHVDILLFRHQESVTVMTSK